MGVGEIPLGLSIGIYTRQPREKRSLEAILEEADRRLYADKRGRHVEQPDDYRR
jgi:GGDEF domain-containing protein